MKIHLDETLDIKSDIIWLVRESPAMPCIILAKLEVYNLFKI